MCHIRVCVRLRTRASARVRHPNAHQMHVRPSRSLSFPAALPSDSPSKHLLLHGGSHLDEGRILSQGLRHGTCGRRSGMCRRRERIERASVERGTRDVRICGSSIRACSAFISAARACERRVSAPRRFSARDPNCFRAGHAGHAGARIGPLKVICKRTHARHPGKRRCSGHCARIRPKLVNRERECRQWTTERMQPSEFVVNRFNCGRRRG